MNPSITWPCWLSCPDAITVGALDTHLLPIDLPANSKRAHTWINLTMVLNPRARGRAFSTSFLQSWGAIFAGWWGDGWCCEAALSCILHVSRVVIGDPISYTFACVHPFDDPSIRWVPEKENPAGYISVVTRQCWPPTATPARWFFKI